MSLLPVSRVAASLTRPTGVLSLLLLLIGPSLAQTAEIAAPAPQQTRSFQPPNFAGRTVPDEALVDLADFISGYLADSGVLPDFMQVRTADGSVRRISAAETFILLARTMYLWETMEALPATVPIAPDEVRAPVVDPEDVPQSEIDMDAGREVPTDQFLAQCGDTVRWVDRLHTIPTAVWVDGQRLSAAEYLAGLAICIQYSYWEETLYDSIYLPRYGPPQSWIDGSLDRSAQRSFAVPAEEAEAETEASYQETTEEDLLQEEPATATPMRPPRESPPGPAPQLTLFPRSGSTISGKVDLVASYLGPPARFVIFAIDGATRAIMNFPPYSYRWDTSTLAPGPHTVRIQILGDKTATLVDQLCGYTVSAPDSGVPGEEPPDDL